MNNETILKRLEEINLEIKNEKLEKLKFDLKQDLMLSGFKCGTKQRLRYCLKHCEKTGLRRPILGFTHFENDMQYYTDSVFAVELHGDDIMKELPRNDEPYESKYGTIDMTNQDYPKLAHFFKESGETKEVDLEKLYNFARVNMNESFVLLDFNGNVILFAPKLIYTGLTFANATKGKATFTYRGNVRKPITLVKENGTGVVITPCYWDASDFPTKEKFAI